MCNAKKVTSTFRFLGERYKIHVQQKNGRTYPVIDKKVFSFLGFSFWKTEIIGDNFSISKLQLKKLEQKGTLAVVGWLKSFARSKHMINN